MRFHASVSSRSDTREATDEVVRQTREALGGRIDVAFVFFTADHVSESEHMLEQLWLELDPRAIIGCSADGVMGADLEIERSPGLALLAGELPGVRIHPFHVPFSDWRRMLTDQQALSGRLGIDETTRSLIGMGDPFTMPVNQFLDTLNETLPGMPLSGGMASATREQGGNCLLRNDQVCRDGFVGVSLSGELEVDTVVSQGCRPIGRPMVITRSRDNVIEQLGGKKALDALQEMVYEMPTQDQEMLKHGVCIGRAISEYRERFGRGDFLVRNILGTIGETRVLGVDDMVRTGQTVQFHVRDASTASEDLSLMLAAQSMDTPAAGALLFTCTGRGTRLFEEPGHDVGVARRAMPQTPVAGFFAAGEFGPVGGRNFMHGHTASFALFRPRS